MRTAVAFSSRGGVRRPRRRRLSGAATARCCPNTFCACRIVRRRLAVGEEAFLGGWVTTQAVVDGEAMGVQASTREDPIGGLAMEEGANLEALEGG